MLKYSLNLLPFFVMKLYCAYLYSSEKCYAQQIAKSKIDLKNQTISNLLPYQWLLEYTTLLQWNSTGTPMTLLQWNSTGTPIPIHVIVEATKLRKISNLHSPISWPGFRRVKDISKIRMLGSGTLVLVWDHKQRAIIVHYTVNKCNTCKESNTFNKSSHSMHIQSCSMRSEQWSTAKQRRNEVRPN